MRCAHRSLFILALAMCASALVSAQVTMRSLFSEMHDFDRLTRRPSPAYVAAQASSYDRQSVAPNEGRWFANMDRGQFVRSEQRYGRVEHVMADLKGPGAVVRIWSANPSGVIRFYFDGEEAARIVSDFRALMSGRVPPFRESFAYEAAKAYNLYFPIPYQSSLKVTVENPPADPTLYYHIGYRTYDPKVKVESFNSRSVYADDLDAVENRLYRPASPPGAASAAKLARVTAPNPLVLNLTGSNAINELRVKVSPSNVKAPWSDLQATHNLLRQLLIRASFDDEECIVAPLGDFFGTAPGLNPFESLPFSAQSDGTMTCRFLMPFRRSAKISIEALGDASSEISLSARLVPYAFTEESYLFHAQWIADRQPPRPVRDLTLLSAKGEGVWIGDSLHVANPAKEWWGEGDEKVFIDGEKFPSTFGTGTEDYFGYGWGSTNFFSRPYHGQPNAPEPNNMGHTKVHRWHIFDPIPFRKSIDFLMEACASNTQLTPTYAHTVYWYALPGGTKPIAIDTKLIAPPEIPLP